MHPEGGSWTAVRTHTPSKFSKVRIEPLAPIPLDRSKFRENGSQPPPNRTGYFRIIRLSSFPLYSFRIVSALRITRTSASFPLGNLLPFAVGLLSLLSAPVDGFPVR